MVDLDNIPFLPSDNYTKGREGEKVDRVIIHDTEGSYQASLDWLRRPNGNSSTSYMISEDGSQVAQLVKDEDGAWHCGNYGWNMRSIGIEMAGYADQRNGPYSDGLYRTTARLTAKMCKKFGIVPGFLVTIFGHQHVPDQLPPAHHDPGPYFDWNKFMSMVQEEMGQPVPTPPPTYPPGYFPETKQYVVNVVPVDGLDYYIGFLDYWTTNGGLSEFGYPLDGAQIGTAETGSKMVYQDFERARLEYHLDNNQIFRGRVGAEAKAAGFPRP